MKNKKKGGGKNCGEALLSIAKTYCVSKNACSWAEFTEEMKSSDRVNMYMLKWVSYLYTMDQEKCVQCRIDAQSMGSMLSMAKACYGCLTPECFLLLCAMQVWWGSIILAFQNLQCMQVNKKLSNDKWILHGGHAAYTPIKKSLWIFGVNWLHVVYISLKCYRSFLNNDCHGVKLFFTNKRFSPPQRMRIVQPSQMCKWYHLWNMIRDQAKK